MKRMRVWIGGLAGGCAAAAAMAATPLDRFVARVNDRTITFGDVLIQAHPQERALRSQYPAGEAESRVRELYAATLDALIDRALILEEAKRRGAEIDERRVRELVDRTVRDQFEGDRTRFLQALAADRVSFEEYLERTREDLLVMLMRRQEVVERTAVPPGAVRGAYRERADAYAQPAQVKLSVIMLNRGQTDADRAAKEDQAERLAGRIRAGESFADLAREYSEGPGAAAGGEWNWLREEDALPVIREAVSALSPGGLSPVLAADDWLFLIRLDARRPRRVIPFEEVRHEIEADLRRAEEQRVYREWLDTLAARHFVARLGEPWAEAP